MRPLDMMVVMLRIDHRRPCMFVVEYAADGRMAEPAPSFSTDALQVQPVCPIKEPLHAIHNLIDVSHFDEKAVAFRNHSRDSANSGGQYRASAGHCFHQHTPERLGVARHYKSTRSSHQISQLGLGNKAMKTDAAGFQRSLRKTLELRSMRAISNDMKDGVT